MLSAIGVNAFHWGGGCVFRARATLPLKAFNVQTLCKSRSAKHNAKQRLNTSQMLTSQILINIRMSSWYLSGSWKRYQEIRMPNPDIQNAWMKGHNIFCPKGLLCGRVIKIHMCVRSCVRSFVRLSGLFLEHFLSSKSQILKGFRRKRDPKNGPKGWNVVKVEIGCWEMMWKCNSSDYSNWWRFWIGRHKRHFGRPCTAGLI